MKKILLLLALASCDQRASDQTARLRLWHPPLAADTVIGHLSRAEEDSSLGLPTTLGYSAPDSLVATENDALATEYGYCIVESADRRRFARQVNRKLAQGYYLRGEMHTERTGLMTFVYLQNMVRRREE